MCLNNKVQNQSIISIEFFIRLVFCSILHRVAMEQLSSIIHGSSYGGRSGFFNEQQTSERRKKRHQTMLKSLSKRKTGSSNLSLRLGWYAFRLGEPTPYRSSARCPVLSQSALGRRCESKARYEIRSVHLLTFLRAMDT